MYRPTPIRQGGVAWVVIVFCASVLVGCTPAATVNVPSAPPSPLSSPSPVWTPIAAQVAAGEPVTSVLEAPTLSAEPAPIRVDVAYVDGNQLYFWRDGISRLIADSEEAISSPKISPDGDLVAYLVALDTDLGPDFRHALQVEQLWVANIDGSGQRSLVSAKEIPSDDPHLVNSPRSFAWRAGTHMLIFNTRSLVVPPGECCPWNIYDDLWTADADSGAVTQRFADSDGGDIYLSPDGRFAALSRPRSIGLYNFDDGRPAQEMIAFPLILTYSEYYHKPVIIWGPDSSFFTIAIPSEDPAASEAHASLYHAQVDGTLELSKTLSGNFVFNGTSWDYPHPFISPDGQFVVYGRIELNGFTSLRLMNLRAANDTVVDWRQSLLLPLSWSPDSWRFVYLALPDFQFRAGEGVVVTREGDIQSLSPGIFYDARWVAQDLLVVHAEIEGRKGLYLSQLDGRKWLLVDGLSEHAEFDVRARE